MTTMTTTMAATATTKSRQPRLVLSLRLRLLGWALALLAVASLSSVVVIRQVLVNQLESRIATDMRQEVTEFRLLVGGRDPATGRPFGGDLRAIADTYLGRNEPGPGETMLIYIDGRFYDGTSQSVPPGLSESLQQDWATATATIEGQMPGHPQGPVFWLAAPVVIDGKTRGQFVILEFTAERYGDINHAVQLMALSCLLVIVVVAAGGYLAMGRALRPLRTVTQTARAIGETDLASRIIVTGTDEVAHLSYTFNTMLDRLQRAFATQQAFLSDAGHELRTPITIVRGHLELMGDDPADRRETVALVTDELDRMNRMVNDLLVLARTEQPDFVQPALTDAAAMMADVFAKATALGERDWQLADHGPAWVFADRQRLTQAVMQLAQNAVQFTGAGGRITLSAIVAGPHVHLTVSDDGIGIEPQDHQRIFDRFTRTDGGRRHTEGSGLGLAIVAAIVAAHHGRIEVESVPGAGSAFTIVLARDEGAASEPRTDR